MSSLIIADHMRLDESRAEMFVRFLKLWRKSYRLIGVHSTQQLDPESSDPAKARSDAETLKLIFDTTMSKYGGMNRDYVFQSWDKGLEFYDPGDFKTFAFPELVKCVELGRYKVVLEQPSGQKQIESPRANEDRATKEKYEAWRAKPIEVQIQELAPAMIDAKDAFFKAKQQGTGMGGLAVLQIVGPHLSHIWPELLKMVGANKHELMADSIIAWRGECAEILKIHPGSLESYTNTKIKSMLPDKRRNPRGLHPTEPALWSTIFLIKQFEAWKQHEKQS